MMQGFCLMGLPFNTKWPWHNTHFRLGAAQILALSYALLTWVEGKVVYKALPGDEGNLLNVGGGATEAQLLQVQERVDEGPPSMEHLCEEAQYTSCISVSTPESQGPSIVDHY